jgi:RNA polymerase primary sigma factor
MRISDRADLDGMGRYLSTIGSYTLLTLDEEAPLAHAAQAGDMVAQERFIVANLRLVIGIARRYVGRSDMDIDDLIQEGNIGLMHALEKFDPQRGVHFSTYAVWWIRQAISRAIDDRGGAIHIPAYLHIADRKAKREDTTGAYVSVLPAIVSMDIPVAGDEDWMFGDTLEAPTTDAEEDAEDAAILARILAQVSEREQAVLLLRYDGRSYAEIGKRFGISGERARQIGKHALRKLRYPAQAKSLEEWVDEAEAS